MIKSFHKGIVLFRFQCARVHLLLFRPYLFDNLELNFVLEVGKWNAENVINAQSVTIDVVLKIVSTVLTHVSVMCTIPSITD